jgi:glycosyltransferase involved in cell wall biosynthesis
MVGMRVAINVEQLLQHAPGGIGRYSARLVNLLGVVTDDVVVAPFCARHPPGVVGATLRSHGVDVDAVVLGLPRPVLYDSWNRLGAPSLALLAPSLRNLDVVHAPSVAVPPRPGNGALVVTVHDAASALFPDAFTPRGRRFHAAGIAAAAARADLVITVSEAARAEIAAATPIDEARIRVVHNGVDRVAVSDDTVRAVRDAFAVADRPYVLWVGSLEPRKNLRTLVHAFALAHARRDDLRLVLAGPEGWGDSGLDAVAADLVAADALRVVGAVSDGELHALYRGAEAFVFPSLHEGFGLPVLEAMAQDTPVVCSDLPVLREIVDDAAVFVDPLQPGDLADALVSVCDDGALRSRLVAAGGARVARFSWEECARRTRDVYVEALSGR